MLTYTKTRANRQEMKVIIDCPSSCRVSVGHLFCCYTKLVRTGTITTTLGNT